MPSIKRKGDTTMTKQEFEERYGKAVNDHVFDNINDLYMSLDGMDKDVFVRDYKKHEESLILNELYNKVQSLERGMEDVERNNLCLIDMLIKKGSEWDDKEVLDTVENQIGKPSTITRKIELGCELSDDDLEYIKHNLR